MNNKTKTIVIAIGLVLLLVLAGVGYNALKAGYAKDPLGGALPQGGASSSAASSDASSEEPQPAPDFTVYDAEGNAVQLSSLIGKPMVLNFWASWCGPCKGEMPDFQAVHESYGDEVTFVMVNMTDGSRETQEKAQKHIDEMGYTFPVYFDLDQDAAATYGVSAIPTTYIIDAEGKLVAYAKSAISGEALSGALDELLK